MNIYAATHKGFNKYENEDRIVIGKSIIASGVFSTEMDDGILAVADGVGGNNAGAVASHFIANRLCEISDISVNSFSTINEELLQLSAAKSEYSRMATTLSGIYICRGKILLYNVGNTRVYLLQGKKYLKQLTSDDTTLNYLLSTGQLSSKEAEIFERRNEITACFGGGNPELLKIKISNIETLNCPIMITSDGIHDYINVDQMEEIIDQYGFSTATCKAFINIAIQNGSCDDISIILGSTS